MKIFHKAFILVLLFFSFTLFFSYVSTKVVRADESSSPSISYKAHVQNIGWMNSVSDGYEAGTTGRNLRLEALQISVNNSVPGLSISYQVHVQNIGWMNPVENGQVAGTVGQGLRLEAIKIKVDGVANYHVQYRVHVQNIGWMDWVQDGAEAGTTGRSLRIEAIQIKLVKDANSSPDGQLKLNYQTRVQNIGWQGWNNGGDDQSTGDTAGTVGKSLMMESIRINAQNLQTNMKIKYQVHVQNIGWMNPVENGQIAGTTDNDLRIEAIKIWLENIPGYKIQYQVQVQNIGWMNWVEGGQADSSIGGTTGQGLRLEAIKIRLVKDSISLPDNKMYIDAPVSDTSVDGTQPLNVSGWALNTFGIKDVQISVDGNYVSDANYGLSRPDVDAKYPGYPNGANSGFNYAISANFINGLSSGSHLLQITSIGNDGFKNTQTVELLKKGPNTIYTNYNETVQQVVDAEMKLTGDSTNVKESGNSWISASSSDVEYYVNPANFSNSPQGVYQFMRLDYYETGITVDDLNNMLKGKGILDGKGSVFLQAAKDANISPIYLVSHALLETGNGTSKLANGTVKDSNGNPVTPAPSYNMFGIGAYNTYDTNGNLIADVDTNGAKYAYNHGWTSPDAAISGGAKFVSNSYVSKGQNTLYKMRWNPDNPATHQYATDIAWADSQTYNLKKLAEMCKSITLKFDIPIYK